MPAPSFILTLSPNNNALADLSNSEVSILDGATVTTTELNIIDGGTSATSTTLATADRFVCNDAGTMKQVALSDLVTYCRVCSHCTCYFMYLFYIDVLLPSYSLQLCSFFRANLSLSPVYYII